MENTSYGINVANRYDLFAIDDEGDDPFQMIASSKQKAQKKQPAQASADPSAKGAKNSEKENKAQNKATINNENRHPDKHADSKAASAASTNTNLHNQQQRGEKHGIKETQKDNIRTTREDGNKNGYAGGKNAAERRPINKSNFTGENREEKNNRKNREVNNDENTQRRSGQAGGGSGSGGNKRFESRGKREFDRQSGSNKTGVKAVEKRDGTGSHNWGSAKADAKEYNNFQEDYSQQETEDDKGHASDQGKDEATNANDQSDTKLPIEEELKEMTLDEWKAQTASKLAKPQYNIRKAGEGEDATQWDKMVALNKKKSETEGTEEENETQKIGKQKQVLDIEFHFNDGRRGGMMGRSRGRGGKGGARNTGKREGVGAGPEKKDTAEPREGGAGGEVGEKRDRRNRPPPANESTFGSYKFAKQSSRFKNAAPKVDDENFPSLG
uniref:Plasminogen activator inhibitor 1 RNA-binding protein n=1 Tax=Culex pipiens TaxID=7175 RepID=A0A8D8ACY6_CULPI